MICAASLSKLLGDDIAARNKDSPKGKKAMESYTRLSNCSPRGSTPLFGLIMGITTEQGMVWGVESLKQTQFCYLASRKGCCLEQAVNFGRVQCTCVCVREGGCNA